VDSVEAGTLKRTPLYEAHVQAGAKLVPFAGWEMPVEYDGIRAEHLRIGAEGLPASVMVVEPLGSHALVTAKVAGTPVKIEAPVDIALKTDEAIHLAFDEARARWMTGDTGAAIGQA